MKKLFTVLMIAGAMAACDTGNEADNKTDSLKETIDSTAEVKKDKIDSAAEAKKAALDSVANRKDSTNAANEKTEKSDKKH